MSKLLLKTAWLKQMYTALCEFTPIPEVEWEKAQEKLHFLKLRKNAYFIHAGDVPDKLAFIISGLVRVFHTSEFGVERVLVFRGENRFLSAYSSFLEKTTSEFSFQALEDTNLLYLSINDYQALLSEHSCWQIINTRYTQMLFVEKEKRELEFLSDDAETRYDHFLTHYAGIENRIRQYQVASYLGITPVALSRIRNRKTSLKN
jgi:CRP-like cAMP-binding protein